MRNAKNPIGESLQTRNRNVLGHNCRLPQDEELIAMYINSGVCVNFRRKFRKFMMVNPKFPETKRILKSTAQIRGEEERHLRHHYYMIHPYSSARIYWENFMIFLYSVLLIVIPIEISSYERGDFALLLVKLICDMISWIDIVLFFLTGFYNEDKQKFELNWKKVTIRYLSSYFIVDGLSSTTLNIALYYTYRQDQYYYKLFTVLKLFRIPTLLRYIRNACERKKMMSYNVKVLTFLICFILLIVWASCIMFMFRTSRYDEKDKEQEVDPNQILSDKLVNSCRAVVIRLMLISNPFSPRLSDVDIIFQIITMLCAITLNMAMLAQVMQIYNRHSSSNNKYNNLTQQIGEYMRYKELPGHLREKVFNYVDFKYQKNILKENDILGTLSTILRQDVLLHNCKRLVERVDFFKDLPNSLLQRLVTKLKSEIYLPNDVIVQAGIAGNAMYFIYIGTVAVYTSTGKEICHLQDGGHFGEISLVINEPRVASCVAVKECELYRLSRKDFQEAIEPFPELSNKIRISALTRLATTKKIMKEER